MRTRPMVHRFSSRRLCVALALGLSLASGIGGAAPAAAEVDWSVPQKIASTGIDLTIVRPLSAVRTGIGAILLVPAAILASPGCIANLVTGADCRPVYEAPYEVLVGEPAEYAFRRELGEL